MTKSKAAKAKEAVKEPEVTEVLAEECPPVRWFIDTDWYERNNRSFLTLALERVCPQCRKKMKGEPKVNSVLAAIRDCCSDKKDYITAELPIMESVFRVVMANGNEPITIDELSKRLKEKRGPDDSRSSPAFLMRLMSNDAYYGFKQSES